MRALRFEHAPARKIYQYSGSWQQQWPGGFVSTVAYVGSQGRNLFLRNIGNRIVTVRPTQRRRAPRIAVRQFDIDWLRRRRHSACGALARAPAAGPNTVLHPYAEIDFKSSGGFDSYNALQTQLLRRFGNGLSLSTQYTYSASKGDSGGSNEALTTANPYDYNLDIGYNTFDLRHNFNLSALYALPFGKNEHGLAKEAIDGWEVGTILTVRSGFPIPVQITRPYVVFRALPGTTYDGAAIDGTILGQQLTTGNVPAGHVVSCPGGTASNGQPIAAGICTEAIINTVGGGNTRNVRRPDLLPGVDLFLPNGNLNPAAFNPPAPGTFGNLTRNSVHGPSFSQVDFTMVKKFPITESLRWNSNRNIQYPQPPHFANPPAQLPNVPPKTPGASSPQPGQRSRRRRPGHSAPESTVAKPSGLAPTANSVRSAAEV